VEKGGEEGVGGAGADRGRGLDALCGRIISLSTQPTRSFNPVKPPLPPPPPFPAPAQLIVERMGIELARFQRERAEEMGYVLRDFALAEAQMAADSARLWRSMVPAHAALDTAAAAH
jgi:hypothetical protein